MSMTFRLIVRIYTNIQSPACRVAHPHAYIRPRIGYCGADTGIWPRKGRDLHGGKLRIRSPCPPLQARKRARLRLYLAGRPEQALSLQAGKAAGERLSASIQAAGELLQVGKAADERMRMQAKAVLAMLDAGRSHRSPPAADLLPQMRLLRPDRDTGAVRALLRVRMDRDIGGMPVRVPRSLLLR